MNKLKTHPSNQLALLVMMLLGFAINANAGLGAVWTTGVTENSITVSWTPPSGDYRLSNDWVHDYMVCYEVGGTWATVCGGGTVNYTSATSYTITGLSPETEYKIRVKCHCERRNMWGNWKNPKWRTIGTNRSSTVAASPDPDPITSYIITPHVTSFSIDVEMDHTLMPYFSNARICYKKRWNPVIDFNAKCQTNPVMSWLYSDQQLGWMDTAPASPSLFTIAPGYTGLKHCTQYNIVGFGDASLIGETMVRTSGLCGFFNKSIMILVDHSDDVLVDYATALEVFYNKSLLEYLGTNYENSLFELAQTFSQNQQENLQDNTTLLAYLIEVNSDLYDRWQQEPALKQAGLTLDSFLQHHYPELNQSLEEELTTLQSH